VTTADTRARLEEQRAATLAQIEALEAEIADVVAGADLVATDDEHDPEGATIAFERARVGALLELARDSLAGVDEALRRLASDSYGTCEVCHRRIDPERLAARPHAARCVTCAASARRWVGGPGVHEPVTFDNCARVAGPFFHGTKVALNVGDELAPGYGSNFQVGRVSNNIYFAAVLETAVWGAELSTALAGITERGRIYVVEPLGPFEDDPNVTDKRFPGNPTRSYRSQHPLRIVGEVTDWQGHDPEVLRAMLASLAALRAEGRDVIED
jgi:rifampin ADP-ribosylating transferase